MESNYMLWVFLLSCLYPFSVFCESDSSEEETASDEERPKPKYGIEVPWIDQRQISANYKSYTEPAGYEDAQTGTTYLCRAYVSETWIPGKLIGRLCYVTKNRVEHQLEEFQVPKIPAHRRTQWITLDENVEKRQLPRNVIVGGDHWDTTAYICRGFLGRVLGTGVVVPGSYRPKENICYLGHRGAQVAWQGDTEILVLDEKVNTPIPLIPEIKHSSQK